MEIEIANKIHRIIEDVFDCMICLELSEKLGRTKCCKQFICESCCAESMKQTVNEDGWGMGSVCCPHCRDKTTDKFSFEPMLNLNEGLYEIEKNMVSEINDFLVKLQIKKCQTEKQNTFDDGLTETISVLNTVLENQQSELENARSKNVKLEKETLNLKVTHEIELEKLKFEIDNFETNNRLDSSDYDALKDENERLTELIISKDVDRCNMKNDMDGELHAKSEQLKRKDDEMDLLKANFALLKNVRETMKDKMIIANDFDTLQKNMDEMFKFSNVACNVIDNVEMNNEPVQSILDDLDLSEIND